MNRKTTSNKISTLAAKTLKNANASAAQKSLAASALSQANPKHQTGTNVETFASNVMKSSKYNSTTKTLAASVLAQSNKAR